MSFSIQIRKIKFPVSILSTIHQHSYACIHMCTCTDREKYTYWFICMCGCIHTLLYMYVYKYVFYIYVYTHIIICVFRVSLLRMDLFLPGHILQKKTIELWASFSEMYIYFVSCDGTGQSPTSHTAFVVGFPHPVAVKSC